MKWCNDETDQSAELKATVVGGDGDRPISDQPTDATLTQPGSGKEGSSQ